LIKRKKLTGIPASEEIFAHGNRRARRLRGVRHGDVIDPSARRAPVTGLLLFPCRTIHGVAERLQQRRVLRPVQREIVFREPASRLRGEPGEPGACQRLMLLVRRHHAIDVFGHAGA
jgi:hypothetical protein